MSESRSKSERAPALRPVPKIPAPPEPKLPPALARLNAARRENAAAAHNFDKAFPVMLHSQFGAANGVGRNISAQGMFIETRDPLAMGTEVRVVFESKELGADITAMAEVRFQCFLNFAGADGEQEGMRGMGVRFLRFEEGVASPGTRTNAH